MTESAAGPGFGSALDLIDGVEGWLTDTQARRLWDAARRLRGPATVAEIGSFRGRSTIVLARAIADGVDLVAIDPHGGGDRGPQEIAPDVALGEEDFQAFSANLARAGVAARVRHVRLSSQDALASDGLASVDLLYVDGAHRYRPAREDLERWGERVPPGGTLLVHDAYNAIGVMLAQLRLMFASRRWRYEGRTGSLAEYRRTDLGGTEVAANLLRQAADLPYFLRNLAIKVLIVMRLRPLTRLLGHDTGHWPY